MAGNKIFTVLTKQHNQLSENAVNKRPVKKLALTGSFCIL
jgi:hypothetical protein